MRRLRLATVGFALVVLAGCSSPFGTSRAKLWQGYTVPTIRSATMANLEKTYQYAGGRAVAQNSALRNTYWLLSLSMVPTVLGAAALPPRFTEPLHDRTRSAVFGYDNSRISDLAHRTIALATANPAA